MDIRLNHKVIKGLCGTVSYKRGEAFYRGGKVKLEYRNEDVIEATVTGTEDFVVKVGKKGDGSFHTSCSCPKLASVKNECQHVAAVLLALHDSKNSGRFASRTPMPSNDLLSIFEKGKQRPSQAQLHFETRKVVEAEFALKPVETENGYTLFRIDVTIGAAKVEDLSRFLIDMKAGRKSGISASFSYDPNLHCFEKETDLVLAKLIEIIEDRSSRNAEGERGNRLLIAPSEWKELRDLLINTHAKIDIGRHTVLDLQLLKAPLPIQFHLYQAGQSSCRLSIKGMEEMIFLKPYDAVLLDDKLFELHPEDSERLFELKKLYENSYLNDLQIPKEQLAMFLEKVVPGLRRIGEVQISDEINRRFMKTPLAAKLYLDRVNNRLLAGVEFHYGEIVLNPLEKRSVPNSSFLIRNKEKEEVILDLMEESLFAKTEGGYSLHNEQLEYEFLYHTLPKLEKYMQIYATTAVRQRIFKAPAPKIRVKVKKERTNWLEFKFEIDGIPEEHIRELLEALEEKRKYFRLPNGSLMSLETREYEEIQRFLKAAPSQLEDLDKGLNVPLISGMRIMEAAENQAIFLAEDSFRQFLNEIHNPASLEYEVPEVLGNRLRDYQVHGYRWMKKLSSYGFGGILADDMGLGKTLQSIAFISSELDEIRKCKLPVLIVCPASLTYNWLSEFMKFTPEILAAVMDGTKKNRASLLKEATEWDVIITSYPLLRQDLQSYEKLTFHTVFFDEAQAFKNPVTQTAKSVLKLQAKNRFALTGTPVENSIEELWSIFRVVFPELFQGLKEYSHLSRETISRRIRPFLLRRIKEDVLEELPEKLETMDATEMLPDQKKLYAAYLAKLRHKTLKHLDKGTIRKNRIKILSGLTRLRQICCHPALFVDGYKGSSAKFEQLLRIVEESKNAGRRVLIFSQFTKMLGLIGKELTIQGIPFFYLDGQTPSEERVDTCVRFNEGERDFFLISLKAGGTGLNLTGADTVILYDLWWNPAVEEQAADRAHRMGQQKTVQVIKLIAKGTIEEKMNELQEKKRNMIEEILEERTPVSLTEEDIKEILNIGEGDYGK